MCYGKDDLSVVPAPVSQADGGQDAGDSLRVPVSPSLTEDPRHLVGHGIVWFLRQFSDDESRADAVKLLIEGAFKKAHAMVGTPAVYTVEVFDALTEIFKDENLAGPESLLEEIFVKIQTKAILGNTVDTESPEFAKQMEEARQRGYNESPDIQSSLSRVRQALGLEG